MHRLLLPVFATFAILAAACGDENDRSASATTTTDGPATTIDTTTSTTTPPTDDWQRCGSPAGFAVSYPDGWNTNDGSVVADCSLFDPEPFTVPKGTDARVAAISTYVDAVPFHEVAAPGEETHRATITVDGHRAVRLVEPGSELYGDHTEATRYVIDLGSSGGEARTLFIDTIDLDSFDYEANVEILDRMVETLTLT